MAGLRWGLLMWALLSAAGASQQRHGGFRRLYVVQPGPGPGPGPGEPGGARLGARLGSISSQPLTYSLDVSADPGAQVRTRGPRSQTTPGLQPLSGVNVCGGHCCHGWSKAQGSQRCTKPNCVPQCQNGGMCLRPQLCVCKPGSKGNACELQTVAAPPFPAHPENTPDNGYPNRYNVIPPRPIPQQLPPNAFSSPANGPAQMKITLKPAQFGQPHYVQQQIHPIHPGQNQHVLVKPKYYHTHHTHTHTHTKVLSHPKRPIPLTHNAINGSHSGRIKVVFTPTICKLTCIGGRCHNNCELGNTTTIISENGHTTDTLTAPNFRVVVCHLPCMNGGRCSDRDKCQCPPNFTGKFCQMAVQNVPQQPVGGYGPPQVHSTHTLPLTYSNGQNPGLTPGIVNIHIQHPPEASVRVHQVSQVDDYQTNGQQLKGSQLGSASSATYDVHHSEKIHGYNLGYPRQHGYPPLPAKNTLGRCFQETAGGQVSVDDQNMLYCVTGRQNKPTQCGKVLPGLLKQDQCCGTGGTSWGFHKCQKCPNKPSIPLIDCPQGYRRINSSECQDLDECQLAGVCANGKCVNTVGSYRCSCRPGHAPNPTFTTCTPDSATPVIHSEKGACFRLVSSGGRCLYPVSAQLSKQLCCCSVGKAWGPRCESCPPPGTAQFTEICPGGRGYTVLPNPPANKPGILDQDPPQPLPPPQRPVDALGLPEESLPEVIERTSPPAPVEILPSNAGQDIAPIQSAEVDECRVNPSICGPGICYNTAESYNCHCHEGYHWDATQNTCIDVDECQDQQVCLRGHCQNTEGSFLCQCEAGFTQSATGDQCEDVDECVEEAGLCLPLGECSNTLGSYQCSCPPGYRLTHATGCTDVDECVEEAGLCSPHGRCENAEGSYRCVCDSGFTASGDTATCEDVDECGLNETLCDPHGFCENRLGSFYCLCDQGYQFTLDPPGCVDVNECALLSSVCGEAQCQNVGGSFMCVCPSGHNYDVMIGKCEATPTVSSVQRKECYYHLSDQSLCESVLSSHVTLQECCCTLGAGWGDNCEVHPCPVNDTDQFLSMCPSGRGFVSSGESLYGLAPSDSYTNADECSLFGQEVCKGGFCLDTNGSYECYCKTGQDYDPPTLQCRDIDECVDESLCVGGQCVNTEGSYMCFCTPPMVLEPSSNQCVSAPEGGEQHQGEPVDYQGICWQMVTPTLTCTRPLGPHRKTTYTECCCLYGEGWGMDCALCPLRNTDDYASMCNLPLGAEGGRPYSRDALVAGPVQEYEASPDYAPPPPEEQPRPPFYDNEEHSYDAFQGLQRNECGVLNGCENGRCVRVQEGFTCDCFDGYVLDASLMACIDFNECSQPQTPPLCQNAKCVNTLGSYRCVCPPGFTSANTHTRCVETTATHTH